MVVWPVCVAVGFDCGRCGLAFYGGERIVGRCKWTTFFAGVPALALVLGYILVLEINGSNARACKTDAKTVALSFM